MTQYHLAGSGGECRRPAGRYPKAHCAGAPGKPGRQWRICFVWSDAGPEDVEIVDYHQEVAVATETIMAPVHPGEILLEEFLKPLDVSQYQLAKLGTIKAQAQDLRPDLGLRGWSG